MPATEAPASGPTFSKAVADARQTLQTVLADAMRAATLKFANDSDWSALAADAVERAGDVTDEDSLKTAIGEVLAEFDWSEVL